MKKILLLSILVAGISFDASCTIQAIRKQEGKTGIVVGISAVYALKKLWNATEGYWFQKRIVRYAALGLVGLWIKEATWDSFWIKRKIKNVKTTQGMTEQEIRNEIKKVETHIGTQPKKQKSWLGWACHGEWVNLKPRIFGPSYNCYVELYDALVAKLPIQQITINNNNLSFVRNSIPHYATTSSLTNNDANDLTGGNEQK